MVNVTIRFTKGVKVKKKKIVLILAIAILAFSKVAFTSPQGVKTKKTIDIISEKVDAKEKTNNVEQQDVKENDKTKNEVVATLKILGTNYSTVVAQGGDNEYYLDHDETGNKNRGGTPFLDYRVDIETSRKLLIYGHNSKYSDMPFKILEEYYNEDFYKNHRIITLKTDKETKKYKIFSVYTELEDWGYMKVNFETLKDWKEHLDLLASKSIYENDTELNYEDKILILQTCSTKKEFTNYKKKYLLVIARKVD